MKLFPSLRISQKLPLALIGSAVVVAAGVGIASYLIASSALSAGFGFAAFGSASPELIALVKAFSAGAVLTMLADTMMPEAFEHGGKLVGVVTTLGFAVAFALSAVE